MGCYNPMLPDKPRGVPRVNDRCVANGICWVLRSGSTIARFHSADDAALDRNDFLRIGITLQLFCLHMIFFENRGTLFGIMR